MLIQIGAHGDPIAQASKIRLVTDIALPMQIDGEPILLTESELIIEFNNQVTMISAENYLSEKTTENSSSASLLNYLDFSCC